MKILITGGAGFIGSHAAEELLADGHEVSIVDDLSIGSAANLPPGAHFHQMSIDSPDLGKAFQDGRFDVVVHCAAQVKVVKSMQDPALDRRINLLGTAAVLDAAKAHGRPRFIFLSTGGAVYGETRPVASEQTIPRPLSYYAVHKYTAERYVELSELSHAILRLSNVYGGRQRSDLEGGVVSIFTDRLLARQPVDVFGDGQQVRDYVYVRDVVGAIRAMLAYPESGIWNVGTGVPTTVNELVDAVAEYAGKPVQVRYQPPRPGEILRSCLDVGKLISTGTWRPRYSLSEGLRETVEQIRRRRAGR